MANSRYEYVKSFEQPDSILPNTWIVVRIDGRGFHRVSKKYGFKKPNDPQALHLMNAAAEGVMKEVQDLTVAYGQSDEFSFVFHPSTTLFERRESKLTTTIVSTFTSYYIYFWSNLFPEKPLSPPLPSFDGRAIAYPSIQNLRDYLNWRQVDCHINNTYNTTFWALVDRGGLSSAAAEAELKGTLFKDKNEILFTRYGINYNSEPEMFKKGSVIYRDYSTFNADYPSNTSPTPLLGALTPDISAASPPEHQSVLQHTLHTASSMSKTQKEKARKIHSMVELTVAHVDIIKDSFWDKHPWILGAYDTMG